MKNRIRKELDIHKYLKSDHVRDHLSTIDDFFNNYNDHSDEKRTILDESIIKSRNTIIEEGVINQERIYKEESLIQQMKSLAWYYVAKGFSGIFLSYHEQIGLIDPKIAPDAIFELLANKYHDLLLTDSHDLINSFVVLNIYENRTQHPEQYQSLKNAISLEFAYNLNEIHDEWAYISGGMAGFIMD